MIKTDFFLSYLTKQVDDNILKSILDNDKDSGVDFTLYSKDDYWNKEQIKNAYKSGGTINRAKFDADYDSVVDKLINYEINRGIKKLASGGTISGDPSLGEAGSPAGSFITNNPVYTYNVQGGSPYTSYGLTGINRETDLRKTKTMDELTELFTGVMQSDGTFRNRTTFENLGMNNLKIVDYNNSGLFIPGEYGKGEDQQESARRGNMGFSQDQYGNVVDERKKYLEILKTKDKKAYDQAIAEDKYGQTVGSLSLMGIQHKSNPRNGFWANTGGFIKDAAVFGAWNTLIGGVRAGSEILQGLDAFRETDRFDEINNNINNTLYNLKVKPSQDVQSGGAFDNWQNFSFQMASTIGQIGTAVVLSKMGVPPKATMVALTLAGAEGVQDAAREMGLDKKTSALVMLATAGLLFKTNEATEYIWGGFNKSQKAETMSLFTKWIKKDFAKSGKRVFDNPIKVGTGFGQKFVDIMKQVAGSHAITGAREELTQETLEQATELGGIALAYHLKNIGDYFGMDLSSSYDTGSVSEQGKQTYNQRFSAKNLVQEFGTSAFFGAAGGLGGGMLADFLTKKDTEDVRTLISVLNKDGSKGFMENARTYANVLKSMKDNGELFSDKLTLNNTGETLAKMYPKIEGKSDPNSINDLLYKKMTEQLRQAVEVFTRTGINDLKDKFDYTASGVFDGYKTGKLESLMQEDNTTRKSTILPDGHANSRTANAYVGSMLDQLLDELAYLNGEKSKVEAVGNKDITALNRKKNPKDVTDTDLQAYKDAVIKGGETSVKKIGEEFLKKRKKSTLKVGQLVTAANFSKQKINIEDSIEGKIAEVLKQITDLQQGGMADKVIKDVLVSSAYDANGKLLLDNFATKNSSVTPLQAFYNVDNSTRQFYDEYAKKQQEVIEAYQQSLVDNKVALDEIERLRGEAITAANNVPEPTEELYPDTNEFEVRMEEHEKYLNRLPDTVRNINLSFDGEIIKLIGEAPQEIQPLDERAKIKSLYLNRIGGIPSKGEVTLVATLDSIKREIELEAAKWLKEGEEYTNDKKIRSLIAEVRIRLAQSMLNSVTMKEANEVVSNNLDFLPLEEEDVAIYKSWAKKQGTNKIEGDNPENKKKPTVTTLTQQTNSDLGSDFVTQISPELATEIDRELNAYLNGMWFTVNGKELFTGLNDLLQRAENGAKAAETNMLREDVRHITRKTGLLMNLKDLINDRDKESDDLFNQLLTQLSEQTQLLAGVKSEFVELYGKGKEELKVLVNQLQDLTIRTENQLREKLLKQGLEEGNNFIKDTFGDTKDGTDFMKDSNDGKDVLGNPLDVSQHSNTNFMYLTTVLNYSNGDFYRELKDHVKGKVPSYVQQDIIKQLVCFLEGENSKLYDLNSNQQLKDTFYLTGRAGSGKTSTVARIAMGMHYQSLNHGVAENPFKLAEDIFTDLKDTIKTQVKSYGKSDIVFHRGSKKYAVKYQVPTVDNADTQALITNINKRYDNATKKKLEPGDYFIVVSNSIGTKKGKILTDKKGTFKDWKQVTKVASKTSRSILALAQHEKQNQDLAEAIGLDIAKVTTDLDRLPGETGSDYLIRLLKLGSNPNNEMRYLDTLDVIVFDEATLLSRDVIDPVTGVVKEWGLESINKALAEYNLHRLDRGHIVANNYSQQLRIIYAGDSLQDGVNGAIKPQRSSTDGWVTVKQTYNVLIPTSSYMSYNFRSGTKSGGDILDYYRKNENILDTGAGRGKLITTEYALVDPIGVMAINPANTKKIDEVIGKIPLAKRNQVAYIYNSGLKAEMVTALKTKYPGLQVLSEFEAQGRTFTYVIADMELTPEQNVDSKAVNFANATTVNQYDLNSKAASVVGRHTRFVLLLTSDKDITSVDKREAKEVEHYSILNTEKQRPDFLKHIAVWATTKIAEELPDALVQDPTVDMTGPFRADFTGATGIDISTWNVQKDRGGFVIGKGDELLVTEATQLAASPHTVNIYLEINPQLEGRFHDVVQHFSYDGQNYIYTTTGKVIAFDENSYVERQDKNGEIRLFKPDKSDGYIVLKKAGTIYKAIYGKPGAEQELALSDQTYEDIHILDCFI